MFDKVATSNAGPAQEVDDLVIDRYKRDAGLAKDVDDLVVGKAKRSAGPAKELEDLGRAFIDSALQQPANSVLEIRDWAFNTHTPKLEIVEPPSDNTLGAKVGHIAGQALNIYLLSKTFSAGSGISGVGIAENTLRFGAAGFAHGSLFQSTKDQPGNFALNRLSNGVIEGGTWAVIGGTASTLTQFGPLTKPTFNSGFVANVTSGGVGGIANAELDAVINHRRFATDVELKRGIFNYVAAATITGGLNLRSQSAALLKGQELSPHLVNRYTTY